MNTRRQLPARYIGDPETTPFVRFDLGEMYPPNTLYADAEMFLAEYGKSSLSDLFKRLMVEGQVGGGYGVLLESTWFALLNSFLQHNSAKRTGVADAERRCVHALRLMITRPQAEAWLNLRDFIITGAEELSGWSESFRRMRSEELNVFRGDDGNYYFHDHEDGLIQVFGTGTTEENRLDFITGQLLHGFLHSFLAMFSIVAIADDFNNNRAQYHRWIKASLPDPNFHYVGANWIFMHFDHSRSFSWRPPSNLCDPLWLAGDVLGIFADTLEIDHWAKRRDQTAAEQDWLNDGSKFQLDYVLETTLKIGNDRTAYIPFEGKVIKWVNGTPEQNAVVSISIADLHDHSSEDEKLNRLLTVLVWEHGQPILKGWGTGGGRSPYPKVHSPRRAAGLVVDPRSLLTQPEKKARTETEWLALALFREAQNSSSNFYEYLCYWKILDRVFPKQRDKKEWLADVAIPKLSYRDDLKEILKKTADLEHYLRETRLNAIKHVRKTPLLNPDNPIDLLAITKETRAMQAIAALVMRDQLKL